MTGTGKSEALLSPFANYRGQRILIDVQDHMTFGPVALAEDPPPLEVDRPEDLDWRHRTVRYVVRRPGDRREMDKLHAAIFNRGKLFVACDEAEDVAPSMGAGAPFWVKKCLKQGRKAQITYGSASQRPFGVDRALTMQAEHALVFPMVDDDDLRIMARRVGMSVDELARALEDLGEHEYLRHTVGVREVLRMPALPASAIDFTRGHVVNPQFTARG